MYRSSYDNHQISLINAMHLVWEQHIYWTRMLLISIASRLPDQNATTARLLQNPYDIAAIFAGYYPINITQRIAQLLTEHLKIGAELITALRDGTPTDVLKKRWYANADEMAVAFSAINPYYIREELQKMLYKHLDLIFNEVTARLAGNYHADIDVFNRIEQETLIMADYFTSGIMKQFPRRFM